MQFETIIRSNRKFVILPYKIFERLSEDAEMLADIEAYDRAKQRIASGEDELIPFSIITRRLDGENEVKIWREYRKLTQAKLAQASGVSREMIAAIETGHKKGSTATLKKLARALKVDLENIA
jgi:DNA-binding XRE family transcriptional regulator